MITVRHLLIGSALLAALRAVATSTRFVSIDAGDRHACAVDGEGSAWCWGGGKYGTLGDSAAPRGSAIPVRVAGAHRFRQLSVGSRTTCATATDDSAWCWGSNSSGELGDSSIRTDHATYPVRVQLPNVAEIHTTGKATCALDKANAVWCWGDPSMRMFGETQGPPARSPRRLATLPVTPSHLAVGPGQACVVSADGVEHCWGAAATPVEGVKFNSVSVGGYVCGASREGQAYCWGYDPITTDLISKPARMVLPP